jgi:dienelactone hydrolase
MKKLFYILILGGSIFTGCGKNSDKGQLAEIAKEVQLGSSGTISIKPTDGLELTADYYPNKDAKTIIILFHQADYSRGEYNDIATSLVHEGFACLAVDLRSGNTANNVANETAKRAKEQDLTTSFLDAKQDMREAINYVSENTDKEIYIWGSSYSAGLALAVGRDERVKKVIAFSPGEYFDSPDFVREEAPKLTKPSFVTGGIVEYDLIVKPVVDVMQPNFVTGYKQGPNSDHGSKTLWNKGPSSDDTWAKVLEFIKK